MYQILTKMKFQGCGSTWYVQWKGNRSLRGGPVTLEIFNADFVDRFFPRETRKDVTTLIVKFGSQPASLTSQRSQRSLFLHSYGYFK